MKVDQIISLGIIAAAGYVGYKILKKLQPTGTPTLDVPGGTGLTETEALNIAQRLLAAMNQTGTNEAVLFNELEPLTAGQLISVYNQFGRPPYFWWGLDTYFGTPIDLFGWFNAELGASDLAKMKLIWNKTGLIWN